MGIIEGMYWVSGTFLYSGIDRLLFIIRLIIFISLMVIGFIVVYDVLGDIGLIEDRNEKLS